MRRPAELTGESPLKQVVFAWRAFADQEHYFPKVPARQADLLMALKGAICHDPWTRGVVQPLLRAQQAMETPGGDKQLVARLAIKNLEACQDTALAERCIKWLRVNHNV